MRYSDKPWFLSYDPQAPKEIDIPEIPVYQFLIDSFQRFPQNIAVYYYGCELTYSELEALTNKFANSLVSLGVRKGDRVGIYMDNCLDYLIAFFSILKAGATVVQISPLSSKAEMLVLLNDAGTKGIITLDYLLPNVLAVKDESPLKFVVAGSLYDFLPVNPWPAKPFGITTEGPLPLPENIPDLYPFMPLLNQSSRFNPVSVNPKEDIAILQYTSGTTGVSKGVMVTHYNLVAYIKGIASIDYKAVFGEEVYPVTLPMSHNYAMFQTNVLPIYFGGKILLMIRFEPEECLKICHEHRPTILRAVPTTLTSLANHPRIREFDLTSIRHIIVGGATVPQEVVDFFVGLTGANVVEGYGLTESTSGVVINSLYTKTQLGMGMPVPMCDARVVDPNTGEDVPLGEDGELLLRGPMIASGYWNKPEETAKTWKDGWLHTGDIVRMTDKGVLQFVSRLKEMIIVSGFNVYPIDVENVLYEHPAVMEAAAIGIPDEHRGEVVGVYIALKPGMELTKEEVIDLCREKLAVYKVPKHVEFMTELPKNPTGKILKKELVKMVAAVNKN